MDLKEMVGKEACKHIKSGMTVGLGTGSTAYHMVAEVGRMIKEENLQITGVTTSTQTLIQARELGIPLASIDEVDHIDITIDGADEVDPNFLGIKGGGAALLYEKIVATYSDKVIWIVDSSKMVEKLGKFPLPVEVIPFGSQQIFNILAKKSYNPTFRKTSDGEFLHTDSGNYIIDLHLETIADPHALAEELIHMTGVVEHGLFLDMTQLVIVGEKDGPKTLHNPAFS